MLSGRNRRRARIIAREAAKTKDVPDDAAHTPTASWRMRLRAAAWMIGFSAAGHLVWEIAQLPLYTLWAKGTRGEQVFAVAHCTAGDVIIAGTVLTAAIVLGRAWSWPHGQWPRVIGLAIPLGIAYTAYSEWLNVYLRASWSYSPAMPLLTVGNIGLGVAPLLQWVVIPFMVLLGTWRVVRRGEKRAVEDRC